MSPLTHRFGCSQRQRGAIGLMAALTMALALMCMLVVIDSGRLYLEKRSLQRIADVSALEAAGQSGTCTGSATAVGFATQAAIRNGFSVSDSKRSLQVSCGTLAIGASSRRAFTNDASKSDAIQVIASHSIPRSIAAGIGAMFDSQPTSLDIRLSATAVATPPLPPLAALTIRTTLVTIDSTRAGLLNTLWGGLLGGTLNLTAVGWNGLADTNINLLSYLDQLAIDIGAKAGDYNSLLATNISVSQLLSSSIKVLPQGSTTAQAAIGSLLGIGAVVGGATVKLQDLLSVQTGLPTAGLDTHLNLFKLLESVVQLANSKSAAFATIALGVPGLSINAKVKVIEPPQLSALGNPALAKANPTGPNRIYVRTAQVRTLISVDLTALNATFALVNTLLAPVMLVLGPLGLDMKILPQGANLDLSLEVAPASSYVTDFTCVTDDSKTLTTTTTTAAVKVEAGRINTSAWNSSSTPLTVQELPLLDLGTTTCVIFVGCQPRVPFGGGGLGLIIGGTGPTDGSILGTTQSHTYLAPADIKLPPAPYYSFGSQNTINSLQNTLGSIHLTSHPATNTTLLGALLSTVTNLVSQALSLLGAAIGNLLSPLLDPVLNSVLNTLGIDLAKVDVGPNLSCHPAQAKLVI